MFSEKVMLTLADCCNPAIPAHEPRLAFSSSKACDLKRPSHKLIRNQFEQLRYEAGPKGEYQGWYS